MRAQVCGLDTEIIAAQAPRGACVMRLNLNDLSVNSVRNFSFFCEQPDFGNITGYFRILTGAMMNAMRPPIIPVHLLLHARWFAPDG